MPPVNEKAGRRITNPGRHETFRRSEGTTLRCEQVQATTVRQFFGYDNSIMVFGAPGGGENRLPPVTLL
jgi:hypothetical protein